MRFVYESTINAPPERVFAFHELPDALRRLTPPWERVEVVQLAPNLRKGARAVLETKLFGLIKVRWVAEHTIYAPPGLFEDVQVSGPFKSWRHRHIIEPQPQGAKLRDEVEYEPPLGWAGRLFAPVLVEPRLRRMFAYRHRVTREWCEITNAEARTE